MAIFLFLLFQGLLMRAHGEDQCSKLQKRRGDEPPAIRFPFWLKDQHHTQDCAAFGLSCYPDQYFLFQLPLSANVSVQKLKDRHHIQDCAPFGLSCYPDQSFLFQLPLSVNVSVQKIDYRRREISINNPIKCFPSLNLSSSPFNFSKRFVGDYSLFTCPSTPLTGLGQQVTCLSSPGHLVYAISSDDFIKDQPLLSCVKMYNISSVPTGIFNQEYSVLSWSEPSECDAGDDTKFELVKDVTGVLLVLAIVIPICIDLIFIKLEKGEHVKIERFLEDYRAFKPTRYTYAEIKKITHKFRDKLGQGGYGIVYKGKLSEDVYIAAKILNNFSGNGDDFINEVATIGTIHHIDVVRLVGYCADGYKKALVYEYLPNDSLEKFISSDKKKGSLGWEKLQDIALGIAKGIEYLHQGCDQRILHFDIKPHNILLDKNFIPKIADFGLAKLCSKDQSAVSMTAARGTVGYIAPEVFSRNFGKVSHKSDVYSFGMLLLEMVGGRKNSKDVHTNEKSDEVYFPEWIYRRLNREEENKIEVGGDGDAKIVKKLTIVGLWCIQWYPGDRPSMKVVLQMLEGDGDILAMPPNPFSTTNPSIAEGNIGARPSGGLLEIISESD